MITNMLLVVLIILQRAIATGESVSQVPSSALNALSPETSTATANDVWVDRLWFTSLSFSLATAFPGLLVKQWIQAYISLLRNDLRAQAEFAHFRYCGIRDWHVHKVIGALPILLHVTLLLFFIGLVEFLADLNRNTANIVAGVPSQDTRRIWYKSTPSVLDAMPLRNANIPHCLCDPALVQSGFSPAG